MRRVGSTPQQRGSLTGDTCPDVLELDGGDYLVIGKGAQLSQKDFERVNAHGAYVGPGEGAVIVPRQCLHDAARQIAGEMSSD